MSGIAHTQSQAVRSPRSTRLRAAAVVGKPGTAQPGIRYDGGPEEGSWRVTTPNSGRPDGGPEEGTRGPGH